MKPPALHGGRPTQLQEPLESHLKGGLRLGITVGLFASLCFPTGRKERLRSDSMRSTKALTGRKRLSAPGMGGEKVLKQTPAPQRHVVRGPEARGARSSQVGEPRYSGKANLLLLIWVNSLNSSATRCSKGRAH